MSFDLDMDGGYENGRSTPPKRSQGKRHILTQEERARGHKLTRADCIKGGFAANRMLGAKGGRSAHAKGTAHALTVEERRRGGLATAAKRRAKREKELAGLSLFDGAKQMLSSVLVAPEPLPAKRDTEPSQPMRSPVVSLDAAMDRAMAGAPEAFGETLSRSEDAYSLGASLAGKLIEPALEPIPPCAAAMGCLCAGHARGNAADAPCDTSEVLSIDPFILSALKRFRLGPLSPLALTRSQRAQVDLMVSGGWLEVTGDSMLQLTDKGSNAITAGRES